MSIKLECSIGEALDKLTILNIKSNKIKDNRRNDVLVEQNYLCKELASVIEEHKDHYKKLEEINLEIWELQDQIRSCDVSDPSYASICCDILNLNDARFIVKKKINSLANSKFNEQKGYAKRVIHVIGMCDKIKMFSLFYDDVYVYLKDDVTERLNICDPFIHIIKIDAHDEIPNGIDKAHDIYNSYDETKTKIEHSYVRHKI